MSYRNKSSSPAPALTPTISSAAEVPSPTPTKIGDIYINTATGKVYVAVATVDSNSWAILN